MIETTDPIIICDICGKRTQASEFRGCIELPNDWSWVEHFWDGVERLACSSFCRDTLGSLHIKAQHAYIRAVNDGTK